MLVPLQWLKEYVEFDFSPAELAEKLTMAGLEVETVLKRATVLSGVVVGAVRSVNPHPNADRLVLCDVDVGGQTLQIVCGASNMAPGDKVPTALHGAVLPGGVHIKRGKIRGTTSEGMMCSSKELELGDDASGIMILPSHLEVGANLNVALGLDEPILDITITPNRCDWASMVGVAREVAVFAGTNLKMPEISFRKGETPTDSMTSVQIDDPDMCPRYAARIVKGVKVGQSPHWMQDRLSKGGLRPINNVVDATNYVLLELGQPLHAFDYELLAEHRIVVRRARSDERIVTIDGTDRTLYPEILVIADAAKPVAIAGIMGGKDTEVGDSTQTILIESAYFDPITIRRGSKKLGLSTEASYRFERSTDPEMVLTAADRAAKLIQEIAGGEVTQGIIDNYPRPVAPVQVTLRPARGNALLGIDIPAQEMTTVLTTLGFSVSPSDEQLAVTVPSFRYDVRREADLIEEVARVYGYDRIPSTSPRVTVTPPRPNAEFCFARKVTTILVGLGMTETISFSFSCPEDLKNIACPELSDNMVTLVNPMSEKQNALRVSLIPGIMRSLQRNLRYGRADCTMFEIGTMFTPRNPGEQPEETLAVVGVCMGQTIPGYWRAGGTKSDFFYVKGIVDALLYELGCLEVTFQNGDHPALSEKATAEIRVAGTPCGFAGEVKKEVRERFDVEEPVFLFELNLTDLGPLTGFRRIHKPLPRFPASGRDLAVIVAEHVRARDLLDAIRAAGGDLVEEVTIFDVYRGPQVPSGMKSLAFSLKYLAQDRTLTDEEVNKLHEHIIETLAVKFHARLREG